VITRQLIPSAEKQRSHVLARGRRQTQRGRWPQPNFVLGALPRLGSRWKSVGPGSGFRPTAYSLRGRPTRPSEGSAAIAALPPILGPWAAARLVTVPAGVSPVGGGCPATTVVIPGGGKGDQPAGSPEVNVSVSDREASNLAGCSGSEAGSPEIWAPRVRIVGEIESAEPFSGGRRPPLSVDRWACSTDGLSGVLENDMPRRNRERKPGTTRGSPRRSRTAKAARINRRAAKSCCACEWGGWGRVSEDGSGQNNPNQSEDPWGRATMVARTAVCDRIQLPDSELTELWITKHTKDEGKPSGETSMPGAGLIRTSLREGLV
jgi:hypothetical protein